MQIITEQDNQRVAESLNAVISGLNHIADDIKQSCADAVMDKEIVSNRIYGVKKC